MSRSKETLINLRACRFDLQTDLRLQVHQKLDSLMAFKLYTSGHKFHIIVGKGHNSRRHIQGKNPLRFYTEEYLQILGLRFYQAPEWQGGSGVIITEI